MQFTVKKEGDICIIGIEGNIALDNVNEMKKYVTPHLEDDDIKGLILNFGKVDFIDSSGIGLIVSIFKILQKKQGKFILSQMSTKNREIFSMTKLDRILPICENDQEAMAQI